MGRDTSMMEIRFLKKEDGEMVLQYRYKAPTQSTMITCYPPEWSWSEWIDVPTVENQSPDNS